MNTITAEFEKSKLYQLEEIVEYMSHSIVNKTVLKKPTGNIIASSFDAGEESWERAIPYDKYVQVIDGTMELMMNGETMEMRQGSMIIIPAHTKHSFEAVTQFKMVCFVIKSGFGE